MVRVAIMRMIKLPETIVLDNLLALHHKGMVRGDLGTWGLGDLGNN